MLRGDDARSPRDHGVASGMDTPRPVRRDPGAAHRVEPLDDAFQVRRRWRFWPFTYPPEPGAAIVVGCDQAFECRFLIGRAVADETGMRRLSCLRPHDEGEPFQRRCRRQHDPVEPQAIDHASDNSPAPIGRGGNF